MLMPDLPATQPFLSRRLHWMNMLEMHATTRPDEIAITTEDEHISWADLHRRAQAVAYELRTNRGVESGDRVPVLSLNNAEYVVAMLAINMLGAVVVPLNIRSVARELDYFIEDTDSRIIFVDSQGAQTVAGSAFIDELQVISLEDDLADIYAAGGTIETVDVDEHAIAVIMYTSGTTSAPKGVMLSHINLVSQVIPLLRNAPAPGPVPTAEMLVVPLFHIVAYTVLMPAFFAATRVVIAPSNVLANVHALADTLEREQVTNLFLVPTVWQALCSLPGIRERDIPLQLMIWGASPASKETLMLMQETFPNANITAGLGQTEMSPITTQLQGPDSVRKMGSVGQAVGLVAARIVDPAGEDVEQGEVGEIVYRGPGLMAGYWNKPEETEEAFHLGWFHSGDLLRADDEGYLYVLDRSKDLIISGGENISSIEVEHAVAAHPKVADASVIGAPHPKWVETPVAIIVPKDPEDPPTLEEIREFLEDRLAKFKMPTRLEILETLPRNPSGKLLKHELRDQFGGEA